jgi:putative phosphoesterase
MRFAVVSDIHGNLPALEAVVADLTRRGIDKVVNLGDSLSGPLLPLETCQFLMAQNWIHLAGNHERQILEIGTHSGESDKYAHSQLSFKELTWIASLSSVLKFAPDVLLCHGTPSSDHNAFLQTAERAATAKEIEVQLGISQEALIICGHTHVPRSVRSISGALIVNPGSVGQPAYADDFPYPHVVETGSPDARYAIMEKHEQEWIPSLISVPYDNKAMARLARLRGRLDWECALLTGYMS